MSRPKGAKNKKPYPISRNGSNNNFFGKKHTEETKRKISVSRMGKNIGGKNALGYKHTLEARIKIGLANTGDKNHKWIKDRSKLKGCGDSKEKRSSRYKSWRKQVCIRDNWKCKMSNQDCKGRLEVHHILGWTEFPKLRYKVNNGITLCQAHHPRKRAEEKRLVPFLQGLVPVLN